MKYFPTDVFQRGDYLYIRGYSNGKRYKDKLDYTPFLFVPDKEGEFRSLKGAPLKRKVFGSMKEASKFIKEAEGVSNFSVHGNNSWVYQYINEEFVRDGKIEFDRDLIKINYLDIETEADQGFPDVNNPIQEITAIGILQGDKAIEFGCKVYKPTDPSITYVLCNDEKDLLEKFLDIWDSEEWSPDVLTGWNIAGFDIPYLFNRIKLLLGEKSAKALSPWGMVSEREFDGFGGQKKIEYLLHGIQVLDYIDVYKKFSFTNQESYKLDHIAFVELGEKKLDYSEYKNLQDLFRYDFQKFIEYNIKDNKLVQKLEAKKKFISNILFFAYDARINYVDAMTTVRVWDVIITNYLLEKRIAVPQNVQSKDDRRIMGGHVKEPKLGLSKWVITFDYRSLYPHLMMGWNISPDTFFKRINAPISKDKYSGEPCIDEALTTTWLQDQAEYLKKNNLAATGNGCLFRRDKQGFLAYLMEKMFQDRSDAQAKLKIAKAKYRENPTPQLANEIDALDNFQQARKIQLNAAYGALANKWFRFYDADIAEAVTSQGQYAIQYTERRMNEYMNNILKTKGVDYVVAIDTDSVHVTFDALVNAVGLKDASNEKILDFLHTVCEEKIEPFLAKCYDELADTTNAYKQKLYMKREAIADKGIWRGAKMYILNLWDKDKVRLKEPQLLMHGIEAVRSSTPMVCRQKIKDALNIIMNGTEKQFQAFIRKFKNEFWELPFEDIARPSSANNLEQFSEKEAIFRKGTPIHIKGSLIYNNYLQQKKLSDKYEMIYSGSKVKYCYLTTPNPVQSSVISAPGQLPPEFNLDKYLNRDTQFNKTFMAPIESISTLMKWKTESVNTLEDLIM